MQMPGIPSFSMCHRHHAVSLLFANDPLLLDFLFLPDRRSLTFGTAAKTLMAARRSLEEQQRLQVRLALEIWLERGKVSFIEACKGLSEVRFEAFLRALEVVFWTGGCACASCRQRYSV